jgi:hypothetical protein
MYFLFIYVSIPPFLPRSNVLGFLVLTSENESDRLCSIFYFTGFVWNKHKTQIRSPFFWDAVPCRYITDVWCCETAYWSHHQENWTFLPLQTRPLISLTIQSTKYPVSWCHTPEEWRPELQTWKSLKIHTSTTGSVYILLIVLLHIGNFLKVIWTSKITKIKQSLYRPITDPEGSRRLRLPDI